MAGHIEISLEDFTYPCDAEDVLCIVCYASKPSSEFVELSNCGHKFCKDCVRIVYHGLITRSMVNIQCLKCNTEVPPEEVKSLVNSEHYEMYLDFSLRKYLSTIPTVRYCLSPDCPFACIADVKPIKSRNQSSDTSRNHFVCLREECKKEYCNECKLEWHPSQSCIEARAQAPEHDTIPETTLKQLNAKQCPSCRAVIEKMDDGTCNEVKCTVCHTTFCWLCMQPVSEMHFLSPTGCPMYGQQRWNRKKRYCCRFWLWSLAPFATLLIALLVIPLIIVLLPIGIGYLIYSVGRKRKYHKALQIFLTILSIIATLLLVPIVGILGGLILIPILLFYAYCFVPVHICMQSD